MDKDQALEKLKELSVKRLDVVGLVGDVLAEILDPALDKMVEDSANPYDNMAKAALYPVLEKVIKEQLEELKKKLVPEVQA